MRDDVGDIAAFYDEDPPREAGRLALHQLEHDLTWRYLDQYLPGPCSVLELGAAAGIYTLELARRGYTVTAVDISAALLEEARKRAADEGLEAFVQFLVADARDLSEITGSPHDVVLNMGPLYHLIHEVDRIAALEQAMQRLRAGGLIFSAFLSRFGVLSDLIRNAPGWIEDGAHVRSMLERGRRPDDSPPGGFRGYLAHASELAPLHQAVGFETMAVVGTEPVIAAHDESYNDLEGEQRERWLEVLHEVGGDPTIVGASRHLLYIGRKPA